MSPETPELTAARIAREAADVAEAAAAQTLALAGQTALRTSATTAAATAVKAKLAVAPETIDDPVARMKTQRAAAVAALTSGKQHYARQVPGTTRLPRPQVRAGVDG